MSERGPAPLEPSRPGRCRRRGQHTRTTRGNSRRRNRQSRRGGAKRIRRFAGGVRRPSGGGLVVWRRVLGVDVLFGLEDQVAVSVPAGGGGAAGEPDAVGAAAAVL